VIIKFCHKLDLKYFVNSPVVLRCVIKSKIDLFVNWGRCICLCCWEWVLCCTLQVMCVQQWEHEGQSLDTLHWASATLCTPVCLQSCHQGIAGSHWLCSLCEILYDFYIHKFSSFVSSGCLTLLEIYWKFTKSPGNSLV